MLDVCVIGAGWAGLTAAAQLKSAGLEVLVVEKARGPGGRCSTRRQAGFAFDHGAQYFTARSPDFKLAVESWQRLGLVAAWEPTLTVFGDRPARAGVAPNARLVAQPGMNAVLKHVGAGLDCRFSSRVEQLVRQRGGWSIQLEPSETLLHARVMLMTAPPWQAAQLLRGQSDLAERVAAVPMNPSWALMLGYDQPIDSGFDAAFDNEGPLAWLARNSSKPGRSGEAWLVHADARWSTRYLETSAEHAAGVLLSAFHKRVPAAAAQTPSLISAHRWRYALAPEPLELDYLQDAEAGLVLAGDWCAGNRIEGAWTSGRAAAMQIVQWLT